MDAFNNFFNHFHISFVEACKNGDLQALKEIQSAVLLRTEESPSSSPNNLSTTSTLFTPTNEDYQQKYSVVIRIFIHHIDDSDLVKICRITSNHTLVSRLFSISSGREKCSAMVNREWSYRHCEVFS
jgi:hypothetical protein